MKRFFVISMFFAMAHFVCASQKLKKMTQDVVTYTFHFCNRNSYLKKNAENDIIVLLKKILIQNKIKTILLINSCYKILIIIFTIF